MYNTYILEKLKSSNLKLFKSCLEKMWTNKKTFQLMLNGLKFCNLKKINKKNLKTLIL